MTAEGLRERLEELAPHLSTLFRVEFGDAVIEVPSDGLHAVALELREIGFDRLGMVTAVDYPDYMMMVYRLQARALSAGLFLKTRLSRENAHVASLVDIWPAANWQEREVYDLFGVHFEGHPDLRRIMLPEDFKGHPLRKDYDSDRIIRRPDYI